ncbi:DJ-1/PfpI family protein [Frondihabitans sp. PAMC 28766]|uniref:DJ-1/PfpI family protein n=1 Tax=Frondihabitans sp. PAMC 28766 TaxID=1795630 RepID=UPI0035199029
MQLFSRLPGATTDLVWHDLDPVATDSGLSMLPTTTFDTAPQADVLMVPGGQGTFDLMGHAVALDFVRTQAQEARYVSSVCTGAFVFGCGRPAEGPSHHAQGFARDAAAARDHPRARERRARRQPRHRRRCDERHRLRPDRRRRGLRRRHRPPCATHDGVRPAAALRLRFADEPGGRRILAETGARRLGGRLHHSRKNRIARGSLGGSPAAGSRSPLADQMRGTVEGVLHK